MHAFLNLWMMDTPFSLDKLIDVPRFVYENSFMSKIDDKSGYDHTLLICVLHYVLVHGWYSIPPNRNKGRDVILRIGETDRDWH